MSETTNLKLFKHDEPLETNTNTFDIDKSMNQNWDKIDSFAGSVNSKISELESNIETLEERTTSLETKVDKHDTDIKDLQSKSQELEEDSQAFRDFLSNITPQGEAEGKTIKVTDSARLPCEITIVPNNEQEISEASANILDLTKLELTSSSKCTIDSKSENEITLTSTNETGASYARFKTKLKAGTWYVKSTYEKISDTDIDTTGKITAQKVSDWSFVFGTSKTVNNANFTLEEDTEIYVTFNIKGTADISTDVITARFYNLMFSKENIDYTPFVPQKPSFEYPSEIETVGNSINLFNDSEYKGVVVSNNSDIQDKSYVPIEFENGQYYIARIYFEDGSIAKGNNFMLYAYNESKQNITTIPNDQAKKYDNANIKYAKLIYNSTGISTYNGKTIKGIKIEKVDSDESEATGYSNYNTKGINLKIQNKNIAPINETDWELTENNTIKNKAKNAGKSLTEFDLKKGQTIKINLKLMSKPSVDTTFSGYVDGTNVSSFGFNGIHRFNLNQIYTRTYTATEDCRIKYILWGNANSDIFEFQLWAELDDTTDYIVHEEQNYELDIQQEMLAGDKIDLGNNKEIHTWEKIVLDGTQDIKLGTAPTQENTIHLTYSYNNASLSSYSINTKSNKLKSCTAADVWNNDKEGIGQSATQLVLRLSKEKATNLEEAKTYLSENNVICYFKKAQATELDLTETQKNQLKEIGKAYTYKGTTNISTDSVAIVDSKYSKDIETLLAVTEGE